LNRRAKKSFRRLSWTGRPATSPSQRPEVGPPKGDADVRRFRLVSQSQPKRQRF
jgi:hypothetical protein